jgi:hypothetical protein
MDSGIPDAPVFLAKAIKVSAHSDEFLILPRARKIVSIAKVVGGKKVIAAILSGGSALLVLSSFYFPFPLLLKFMFFRCFNLLCCMCLLYIYIRCPQYGVRSTYI